MSKNSNLTRAKKAKNDEFYTQATDIEKELKHYRDQFRGKVVYCNCDDPTYSEFWRYFHLNFHFFGMKELISTHYDRNQSTYALFYRGGNGEADDADYDKYDEKIDLKQDGDFRSEESIELLKRSDMVVTNEPWSLTREYIAQLMKYHKKFLIIVNKNAITYKEIFPLLMQNKLWIGDNKPKAFNTPNGMTKKISGLARWFTNMPLRKSSDKMTLFKRFDIDEFPIYDNYAAFNVDKVANIPVDREIKFWLSESRLDGFKKAYGSDCKVLDHNGNQVLLKVTRPIWGVPITFMDHYNPSDLILSQQVDQIVSQIDSSSMEQLRAKDEGSQMGSMSMDLEQLNQLSTANGNTNGFSLKSVDLISENSDSTAQQLNSSTAQQLNSSTAQQLNSSTAQQLNSSMVLAERFKIIGLDRYTIPKSKLIGGRSSVNGRPKYARIFIR